MRRIAIRLIIVLVVLLVAAQFAIPPLVANHVEKQLTEHGGTAQVDVSAFPAPVLLFQRGGKLHVHAARLSVDLDRDQSDVFKKLDDFSDVVISITDSRAGPFSISEFAIERTGNRLYDVAISGDG